LGESRLTNVKVKVDGRTVKRSIVLSEDELKSLSNPPEGKRSQDILKEITVKKL